MKFISSRTHGIIDYIVATVLILAPWIFNLDIRSAEGLVPLVLGISTAAYSLMTRYELGVIKAIPFPTHLVLDALSGVGLAVSPWIFGFSDRVWLPHVIVGLLEVGVVMMTRSHRAEEDVAVARPLPR